MLNNNEMSPKVDNKTPLTGSEVAVKKTSFWGFMKKHPVLTTFLFGLLAVVVVFFWKDIEGKSAKKAVIEVATAQLLENNRQSLMLLSKPLVWSIRSEMLRGNLEQVNLLVSNLVKEKNFKYIHLIGPDGNVLLSTNKTLEGKPLNIEKAKAVIASDTTTLINEAENVMVVVAPVMGYDSRLATLVFGYQTGMPDFKK
jgi:hypothetical protein